MLRFNFLDLATAESGFEAFGKDLNELFANAALAVQEAMTDTSKIEKKIKREFEVSAEDLKALLFDFLSEFLVYKDSESLLFSEFDVKIEETDRGYKLNCSTRGEQLDPSRHELRADVKGITYHRMEIKKNAQWRAQVVLDV